MAELLEKTQSSYFLAFKTIFKEVICGECFFVRIKMHVNVRRTYTIIQNAGIKPVFNFKRILPNEKCWRSRSFSSFFCDHLS